MPETTGSPTTTAKGLVASLLDLSFTEFVTARLVKVLYVLTLIAIVIVYVIIAVSIFSSGDSATTFDRSTGQIVTVDGGGSTGLGLLWLFVLGPLAVFLYTLFYRVLFELIIVIFRIFEFNREQTELLRRMAPGDGTAVGAGAMSSPGSSTSQGPPEPPAAWGAPTA